MLLRPSKFDYCICITPPQTQPSSVTDNSKGTPESVFSGSCRRWRVVSVEYLPLSESLSESTIHAPHRRPYICALKIKDEIDTFSRTCLIRYVLVMHEKFPFVLMLVHFTADLVSDTWAPVHIPVRRESRNRLFFDGIARWSRFGA